MINFQELWNDKFLWSFCFTNFTTLKLMGIVLRAYELKNVWMVEGDETSVDIDVLVEDV